MSHWDHKTYQDLGDREDPARIVVANALPESVEAIIEANELSEDGRSQWVWVRFPNGDLMLGTFPQGETYFEHEEEYP